jgi:hypothetical protein
MYIHLRSKSCCITCTLFIHLHYLKLRTFHVRQITLVYNKQPNNPTKQGPSLANNNVLLGQKMVSVHEAQIPTTALTRTLISDQISPHSHKCLRHVNGSFQFTPSNHLQHLKGAVASSDMMINNKRREKY